VKHLTLYRRSFGNPGGEHCPWQLQAHPRQLQQQHRGAGQGHAQAGTLEETHRSHGRLFFHGNIFIQVNRKRPSVAMVGCFFIGASTIKVTKKKPSVAMVGCFSWEHIHLSKPKEPW
jgi:hypothetical protein